MEREENREAVSTPVFPPNIKAKVERMLGSAKKTGNHHHHVEFRRMAQQIALILAYEATLDPAPSPLSANHTQAFALVPIMRSGMSLVDGFAQLLPDASVWHTGLYQVGEPPLTVEYFNKFPPRMSQSEEAPCDVACTLDFAIGAGSKMLSALDIVEEWGPSQIRAVAVIASHRGLLEVAERHPRVLVYVAAVQESLEEYGNVGQQLFGAY